MQDARKPVDLTREFIPEELTPLHFTRAYAELAPRHRIRYNQLQALFFNEQIVFFETLIGDAIMAALLKRPWPEAFAARLRAFHADEQRHSDMFRALNRRCAPSLYAARDFVFVRVGRGVAALLRWAARRPRLFPVFLWLILLQEERSLHFSRVFLRNRRRVEPHFVAVYRAHLVDEARHVRCDEELLEDWWPRTAPWIRRANAKLLAWMVGEFFTTPKRGQVRVVEVLAQEYPELRPLLPRLRSELRELAVDERYRATLYSRDIVPRTFARFDRYAEFRVLEPVIGYRAAGGA